MFVRTWWRVSADAERPELTKPGPFRTLAAWTTMESLPVRARRFKPAPGNQPGTRTGNDAKPSARHRPKQHISNTANSAGQSRKAWKLRTAATQRVERCGDGQARGASWLTATRTETDASSKSPCYPRRNRLEGAANGRATRWSTSTSPETTIPNRRQGRCRQARPSFRSTPRSTADGSKCSGGAHSRSADAQALQAGRNERQAGIAR